MNNSKIINLNDAKNYYFEMSCSHFHMYREYPKKYSEYRKLLVSKELEEQWTMEFLISKLNSLKVAITSDEIISVFSAANTAINSTYNVNTKEIYLEILDNVIKNGDSLCKLIVLETMAKDTNITKEKSTIYMSRFYEIADKVIYELEGESQDGFI